MARDARLLLVAGSSLNVYPVADLPQETLSAGGTFAIVNREPTPLDHLAALTVAAPAGETLTAVCRHLEL